jgi:hypothetical protein
MEEEDNNNYFNGFEGMYPMNYRDHPDDEEMFCTPSQELNFPSDTKRINRGENISNFAKMAPPILPVHSTQKGY